MCLNYPSKWQPVSSKVHACHRHHLHKLFQLNEGKKWLQLYQQDRQTLLAPWLAWEPQVVCIKSVPSLHFPQNIISEFVAYSISYASKADDPLNWLDSSCCSVCSFYIFLMSINDDLASFSFPQFESPFPILRAFMYTFEIVCIFNIQNHFSCCHKSC